MTQAFTTDGRLVGFLGRYAFGSEPELAGAVDPAARRRGLGTALLTALREPEPALLVVPRTSTSVPSPSSPSGWSPPTAAG